MFKLNKKTLFVLFALGLFAIGAKISLIIQNGIGGSNDIIFTSLLFFSLSVSCVVLYKKIYSVKKTEKK